MAQDTGRLKVSIIIPIIRPEHANRCIAACIANAGIPQDEFEIIAEEDKHRIGCPKMVKRLTDKAKADLICFLGDDTIPQQDFLKNAIRAMEQMPMDKEGVRWGLVSFNDNPNTSRSAAHWIGHRRLLEHLGGEFFHTGYKHCYCDDELMMRAQQLGRYIYAYDAIVYHEHPDVHKDVPVDDTRKNSRRENMAEDHALFIARAGNGWKTPEKKEDPRGKPFKVVIGIPSGDMIHTDFAMSFVNLCLKSYQAGIHIAVVNQKSSIVEVGRSEIVAQALALNADALMFLDSDMTFPADTLIRLMNAGKDVVCCDAVKRREPFDQVLRGMDGERLDHNGKEPYVEVKGASCACALIRRKVLDKLPVPPFLVTWTGKAFLGEDYYFGNAVRKAGFKIYCDSPLSRKIGHIGNRTNFIKPPQAVP